MSASADSLPMLAARVLAGFLGGFAILNILGAAAVPRFDANGWWIDWHPWAPAAGRAVLLAAGAAMLGFAFYPRMGRARLLLTRIALAALILRTLWNAAAFFLVAGREGVRPAVPVPLSLFIALVLGWLLAMTRRGGMPAAAVPQACDCAANAVWPSAMPTQRRPAAAGKLRHATLRRVAVALVAAGLAIGFPLAQMIFFGKTDYRRPADVIVVFGAGVNRDGSCSEALADRVSTACRLYQEGYADRLILSGGPGRGDIHETEGMRRLAVQLGVPDEAIIRDEQGLSTQATVDNTPAILEELGARRILAVSHWYHLPRVKMTYQRAGLEVYTVPAEQRRNLRDWPWLISREVAALWAYYLRPLAA